MKNVDFGAQMMSVLNNIQNQDLKDKIHDSKVRAHAFLKKLIVEITRRLPDNMSALKQTEFFSPRKVLDPSTLFSSMPFLEIIPSSELNQMEDHWQEIQTIDWAQHGIEVSLIGISSNLFHLFIKIFIISNQSRNSV